MPEATALTALTVVVMRIETYNSVYDAGVIDVLESLRGRPYPGVLAGTTRDEFATWLGARALPDRRVAEVGRLFVHPEARQHGVGRALLDAAVACLRDQCLVPVLRVSDYATAAIALYNRSGWVRLGEVTSALSGDRLIVFALLT